MSPPFEEDFASLDDSDDELPESLAKSFDPVDIAAAALKLSRAEEAEALVEGSAPSPEAVAATPDRPSRRSGAAQTAVLIVRERRCC